MFEKNGYQFDYESGKLRKSDDNHAIDLSLMYTCKSIAAEMHGVALGTNTITFSTMYSKSENEKGGPFSIIMEHAFRIKKDLLNLAGSRITPELTAEIAHKFPQYLPVLDRLRARGRTLEGSLIAAQCWGEAPSVHRAFVDYALERLLTSTNSARLRTDDVPRTGYGMEVANELASLNLLPWSIPSETQVAEISRILKTYYDATSFDTHHEYRLSAAAVAIRFFKITPYNTRLQIRNVIVNEDRISIANPECHAVGLIPFCLENPWLHIERRVSLWRNAFPAHSRYGWPIPWVVQMAGSRDPLLNRPGGWDQLEARIISKSFTAWIIEALALFPAGMPMNNSFSLVFDGEPTPDRSSQVFARVKRDAAWQLALDQWYVQKSKTPSFLERRNEDCFCYQFEAFPQIIKDVVERKSFISCNFSTDPEISWDADQVLEKNHDFHTIDQWNLKWLKQYQPEHFQTSPPLPAWFDLRLEQALPS